MDLSLASKIKFKRNCLSIPTTIVIRYYINFIILDFYKLNQNNIIIIIRNTPQHGMIVIYIMHIMIIPDFPFLGIEYNKILIIFILYVH